jgi:hypothetical protein
LVRIRQYLFLSGRHAHRAFGRKSGRRGALASLSSRANLQDLWVERFPVQHFRDEGALYVARPAAYLRDRGVATQAASNSISSERFKGSASRACGRSRRLDACVHTDVFTANYAEQQDISDEATLRAILDALRVDAERALAAASSPETKQALRRQNEDAVARGLFGAPSFTVGDELFWGNDRLEEALAWAMRV